MSSSTSIDSNAWQTVRKVCTRPAPTRHLKLGYGLSWSRLLAGLGLVLLNWPLAIWFYWPYRLGLQVAGVAACGGLLVVIFLICRMCCADITRLAMPLVAAGFMSFLSISTYNELESTMQLRSAVPSNTIAGSETNLAGDQPTLDQKEGIPRWELTGTARKTSLAPIPTTAIETTVCATPIATTNSPLISNIEVWGIEIVERRSLNPIFGKSDFHCLESTQDRIIVEGRLFERQPSSLINAAILDSANKFGVAAAPQLLLIRVSRSPNTLLKLPGSAFVLFLVALNVIYVYLILFAVRRKGI